MKKWEWESKSLPTSKAAIGAMAQAAIGTRAGKVKREGTGTMVAEAAIATLLARGPAKDGVGIRDDKN